MGEIMSTIYLLFVILTDQTGYETMLPVTNIKHHSMLECKVEKAQHKGVKGINGENIVIFFCADELLYQVK